MDDTTPATPAISTTPPPRNLRAPLLAAAAAAGLVFGAGGSLPLWRVWDHTPILKWKSLGTEREDFTLRGGTFWEWAGGALVGEPPRTARWRIENGWVAFTLVFVSAVAGLFSFWVADRILDRTRHGSTPATHP